MIWDNNEVQFARLLCELVAENEALQLEEVAKSMDLELKEVNELLDRAHSVFEKAKVDGASSEFDFVANKPNERYWIGAYGKKGTADIGVLFNEDGVSVDVWRRGEEDSPISSIWLAWDDINPL